MKLSEMVIVWIVLACADEITDRTEVIVYPVGVGAGSGGRGRMRS